MVTAPRHDHAAFASVTSMDQAEGKEGAGGEREIRTLEDKVERLFWQAAAAERLLDGVLRRMGVDQAAITHVHQAQSMDLVHGIGAANLVHEWLTGESLWSQYEDSMCGRYAITAAPSDLRALFGTSNPLVNFDPNYNAAPTQALPVVRLHPKEGTRHLDLLQWGLVPSWADPANRGPQPTNARAETLLEKPMFKQPFQRGQRCLIPMNAFYEWKKLGNTKQPYAFALRGREPFAVAGLWEWKKLAGNEVLRSFTVITGKPNELVQDVHDRMPMILPESAWSTWLGEIPNAMPDSVLKTLPAELMQAWKVDVKVGSVKNNSPDLLEPLPE